MSILRPEAAAIFGTLDSTAIADGLTLDAHALRVLGRSANRLMIRGGPLLVLAWDVSTPGASYPGTNSGRAIPAWTPLTPDRITCHKMPGTTTAKLRVRHKIDLDAVVYLQVATRASPFVPASTEGTNRIKLSGTGGWTTETLDDIPIAYEHEERISLWLYGVPSTDLAGGDIAPYDTGTISGAQSPNIVIDTSAVWTTDALTDYALGVVDSSGADVIEPRVITSNTTDRMTVWPPLSEYEARAIVGETYEIRVRPSWQLGALSLYANDRSLT